MSARPNGAQLKTSWRQGDQSMSTSPTEDIQAIQQDERYIQGKKCIKEKKFEDAVQVFSALLETL